MKNSESSPSKIIKIHPDPCFFGQKQSVNDELSLPKFPADATIAGEMSLLEGRKLIPKSIED